MLISQLGSDSLYKCRRGVKSNVIKIFLIDRVLIVGQRFSHLTLSGLAEATADSALPVRLYNPPDPSVHFGDHI